jgi:hypothetical protein
MMMIMVTLTMVIIRTRKEKGKTLKENTDSVKQLLLVYITSIILYVVSKVKYIQFINNCIQGVPGGICQTSGGCSLS